MSSGDGSGIRGVMDDHAALGCQLLDPHRTIALLPPVTWREMTAREQIDAAFEGVAIEFGRAFGEAAQSFASALADLAATWGPLIGSERSSDTCPAPGTPLK